MKNKSPLIRKSTDYINYSSNETVNKIKNRKINKRIFLTILFLIITGAHLSAQDCGMVRVGHWSGYTIQNKLPFRSQLDNITSYGKNGTYNKIRGFTFTDITSTLSNQTVAQLVAQYDIINTGYANMSLTNAQKIKQYVDAGGVALIFLDAGSAVGSNLHQVFGGTGTVGNEPVQPTYATSTANAINNGIWGDARNVLLKGYSSSALINTSQLPSGTIQLANDGTKAKVWITGTGGKAIFTWDEGIFDPLDGSTTVSGTDINTPQEKFIHNLMVYALDKLKARTYTPTPTTSAGGGVTFCMGGNVTLTSSSVIGNQWYKGGGIISGATGQTYNATTSGIYTVVVTSNGCPSTPSAGITVTVNPTAGRPTVNIAGASCSTAGSATVNNYNSTYTYTFSPIGPSVGTGGTISGMVTGTSYTVTAKSGTCTSTASNPFSITEMLSTPAIPTVSITAGSAVVSNYNSAYTYIFSPTGPLVAAGGLISGMTAGTSYALTAQSGTCTSAASTSFSFIPATDIYITKTDGKLKYISGTTNVYTIEVGNNGPADAQDIYVFDDIPYGLSSGDVTYTAVASGGASTSVIGTMTGDISDIANIPIGGKIVYTVTVQIPTNFTGDLVNQASAYYENDSDLSNNEAKDRDVAGLCFENILNWKNTQVEDPKRAGFNFYYGGENTSVSSMDDAGGTTVATAYFDTAASIVVNQLEFDFSFQDYNDGLSTELWVNGTKYMDVIIPPDNDPTHGMYYVADYDNITVTAPVAVYNGAVVNGTNTINVSESKFDPPATSTGWVKNHIVLTFPAPVTLSSGSIQIKNRYPHLAETPDWKSQGDYKYYFGLPYCLNSTCTKPATLGTPDGYSKVGITIQQKQDAWPENIPNGHIALESKTKGFVITRVANQNAIADPKEGMLIYDIAAACVKLYNGTVWNCIKKSCDSIVEAPRKIRIGRYASFTIGAGFAAFESQLNNPVNYGLAGTFKGITGFETIDISSTLATSTGLQLKGNFDIVNTGYATITAVQAKNVADFVKLGGVAIINLDNTVYNYDPILAAFGITGSNGIGSILSSSSSLKELSNVFGDSKNIVLYGADTQGRVLGSQLPTDSEVYASETAAGGGASVWTIGGDFKGKVIFVWDEGLFRAPSISGTSIDQPQERFIHNLMTYALIQLGFQP